MWRLFVLSLFTSWLDVWLLEINQLVVITAEVNLRTISSLHFIVLVCANNPELCVQRSQNFFSVCSPIQKNQTLWLKFLSPILPTPSGWWPARRLRGPGLNRFTWHCGESCNPRFGILTVAERGAMQRKLLRWNSVLHLYTLTQQAVAVTLQGVMRKWLYGRLPTSWQSLTWQVQSAWVSGLCLHTAVPDVALSSFQEQCVAGWCWTFYDEFNLESICSAGAICCTVKGQH